MPPLGPPSGPSRTVGSGGYPTRFQLVPEPPDLGGPWPEPPDVDRPEDPLVEAAPEPLPRHYDLALFEALNDEYADRPIVSEGVRYDPASLDERSRRRLAGIHRRIGLAGMTVLEVGCGAGYEVWHLAHHLGADAWGIDLEPRRAWPLLAGDRVHLVSGDIAGGHGLPPATFDRAISFSVWEHIAHPRAAFRELYRLMRPGGLAWIRANLYRGPTASHLSREIAFPFPHLLFPDDVIAEGLRRAGHQARGAAWVNRLTWEQYERLIVEAGFGIRSLTFDIYPLDEAFYRRFEDVLGRYPREDLERGFFNVTLEKPATRGSSALEVPAPSSTPAGSPAPSPRGPRTA